MYESLFTAIELATRIGLRQTNITLDLPEWDKIQKRDRLLGVSLDGVMDFVDAVRWDDPDNTVILQSNVLPELSFTVPLEFETLLRQLKVIAQEEARNYAKKMRVPEPLLVTTIKPSGTLSKLPGISSGVHRSRAPYYIRRVRITSSDPLARVMLDAGYPVYPENNSAGLSVAEFNKLRAMEKWEVLQKALTWVIEFPMKSSTKIGIDDEPAIEQFKRYLLFQSEWTDHNTSITINFSPDEVAGLVDSILENWDEYIAVSFLPKSTAAYPLLPEEAITEEEYTRRINDLPKLTEQQITEALATIERTDMSSELLDADCVGGACPVR